MDAQDYLCPYSLSSQTAVKGMALDTSVGKEDPVELDHRHFLTHAAQQNIQGKSLVTSDPTIPRETPALSKTKFFMCTVPRAPLTQGTPYCYVNHSFA